MSRLRQIVIYDRPRDLPGGFVVREWFVSSDGIEAGPVLGIDLPSIDAARALVPPDLYNVGRMPGDDPVIVEVWI